MIYFAAQKADLLVHGTDDEKKEADDMLGFLTPILKAFCTEAGYEAANHGVQVFGGHGFIAEWGMEQIVRDTRIALLYEGTTGIQALDLLGRKVLMTQGAALKNFTKLVHTFCKENAENEGLAPFVEQLTSLNKEWGDITMKVGMNAMKNRDEVGAASVDYLMFSGYTCLAYFWAKMASVAQQKLAEGTTEEAFYKTKLQTAKFYFERILPRTLSHAQMISAGSESMMAVEEDNFMF